MTYRMYVIETFAQIPYQGNYAAVIPLDHWIDSSLMQAIATKSNMSETAFFVQIGESEFEVRCFSPFEEVCFCGHATLASAYVIFRRFATSSQCVLRTGFVDALSASRGADGLVAMSFPKHTPSRVHDMPMELITGLSIIPTEVWKSEHAYTAVYASEEHVLSVLPFTGIIARLGPMDLCVTAQGHTQDFVSRYFSACDRGYEDATLGIIRSGVAPLWAARLRKSMLVARQAFNRSCVLQAQVEADRVCISGAAMQCCATVIAG